jgi:hypothetical protein
MAVYNIERCQDSCYPIIIKSGDINKKEFFTKGKKIVALAFFFHIMKIQNTNSFPIQPAMISDLILFAVSLLLTVKSKIS